MKRSVLVLSLLATSTALAQPPQPADPPAPEPAPAPPPEPPPAPPEPAPPPPPPATTFTPAPPPIEPEPFAVAPVTQSVLPNLWSTAPGTTIEVRLDYSDIDNIDLTILNAYARGQYLTPQGYGGYIAIPFGYVEDDEGSLFGVGGAGIGNLEIGGLLLTKSSPKTDVLLRAGASIDTTSEDDEFAVTLSTVLPRLADTYATALQTTWARAQGQLRHASNNLRLGAGVGVDVPVAGEGADQDGFYAVVNLVAAAGLQQDKLGLGVSFVMVQPVTDGDDDNVTGLNLSGDYLMNPNARLFFTLGFSLEDGGGTAFGLGTRASF